MRISDWSSDVCSSDLSTRKSTASGPRARREPGAVPRLEADGRRSGATCAGRRHAARCDSGTRAEIGIISPAGPVARHAVLHRPWRTTPGNACTAWVLFARVGAHPAAFLPDRTHRLLAVRRST